MSWIWSWIKRPSGNPKPGAKPKSRAFHAIEIVAGPQACTAAREHAGRRFLSLEAPRLPLSACQPTAQCQCLYKHHTDRRSTGKRRERARFALLTERGPDQIRMNRGRRWSD